MPFHSRIMGRQNGGIMRPMGRMPKDVFEGVSSAGHAQLTKGRRMGRNTAPVEVVNGIGNLFYKFATKGKPVPEELHPKIPTTLIPRDHAGRPMGHQKAHNEAVKAHNERFESAIPDQGHQLFSKVRGMNRNYNRHYY
mgnify:CR=1 FL=1